MALRKPQLYSLFEYETVNGQRQYKRISALCYRLSSARVVFQGALLAPLLGGADKPRCLRPVKNGLLGSETLAKLAQD